MSIHSEHLDNQAWRILKTTLDEKRSCFLFADREYYETTLADLRSVANAMNAPVVTFDGESHVIVHNRGCVNEFYLTAFTIFGEVTE